MKVLIFCADPLLADALPVSLESSGFNIAIARDVEDAAATLRFDDSFDAAVVDEREALIALRGKGRHEAIVIMASASAYERALMLDAGADAAIQRPFDGCEIAAIIRATVRRAGGHVLSIVRAGNMTIDFAAMAIMIDDRPVRLSAKEYQAVEAMAMRPGVCITKEMMMGKLYGGRDEPAAKILDVMVSHTRRKLFLASGGKDYIQTIWGRGWMLRSPDGCPPPARLYLRGRCYREAFQ